MSAIFLSPSPLGLRCSVLCAGFGVQSELLGPQRFFRLLSSVAPADFQQQYDYDHQCAEGKGHKNPYPDA